MDSVLSDTKNRRSRDSPTQDIAQCTDVEVAMIFERFRLDIQKIFGVGLARTDGRRHKHQATRAKHCEA